MIVILHTRARCVQKHRRDCDTTIRSGRRVNKGVQAENPKPVQDTI